MAPAGGRHGQWQDGRGEPSSAGGVRSSNRWSSAIKVEQPIPVAPSDPESVSVPPSHGGYRRHHGSAAAASKDAQAPRPDNATCAPPKVCFVGNVTVNLKGVQMVDDDISRLIRRFEEELFESPGRNGGDSSVKRADDTVWFVALDLSENKLTSRAFEQLVKWFTSKARFVRLRNLRAFRNSLTDGGAVALASLIRLQASPLEELHLSHNELSAAGAGALFKAFAEAVHPQSKAFVYPRFDVSRNTLLPVWIRLEYNLIVDTHAVLQKWESEARKIRRVEANLRLACFADRPNQPHGSKDPHCSPARCVRANAHHSPLLHLYSYHHQVAAVTVPLQATASSILQSPTGSRGGVIILPTNAGSIKPEGGKSPTAASGQRKRGGTGKQPTQDGSGPLTAEHPEVVKPKARQPDRRSTAGQAGEGSKKGGQAHGPGAAELSQPDQKGGNRRKQRVASVPEGAPLDVSRVPADVPGKLSARQAYQRVVPSEYSGGGPADDASPPIQAVPSVMVPPVEKRTDQTVNQGASSSSFILPTSIEQPVFQGVAPSEQKPPAEQQRLPPAKQVGHDPRVLQDQRSMPMSQGQPQVLGSLSGQVDQRGFPNDVLDDLLLHFGGQPQERIGFKEGPFAEPPFPGPRVKPFTGDVTRPMTETSNREVPLYIFVDASAFTAMRLLHQPATNQVNLFSFPAIFALCQKKVFCHSSMAPFVRTSQGQEESFDQSQSLILMMVSTLEQGLLAWTESRPFLRESLKDVHRDFLAPLAKLGVVESVDGSGDMVGGRWMMLSEEDCRQAMSLGLGADSLRILDFAFAWSHHLSRVPGTARYASGTSGDDQLSSSFSVFLTSNPIVERFFSYLMHQQEASLESRSSLHSSNLVCVGLDQLNTLLRTAFPTLTKVLLSQPFETTESPYLDGREVISASAVRTLIRSHRPTLTLDTDLLYHNIPEAGVPFRDPRIARLGPQMPTEWWPGEGTDRPDVKDMVLLENHQLRLELKKASSLVCQLVNRMKYPPNDPPPQTPRSHYQSAVQSHVLEREAFMRRCQEEADRWKELATEVPGYAVPGYGYMRPLPARVVADMRGRPVAASRDAEMPPMCDYNGPPFRMR